MSRHLSCVDSDSKFLGFTIALLLFLDMMLASRYQLKLALWIHLVSANHEYYPDV